MESYKVSYNDARSVFAKFGEKSQTIKVPFNLEVEHEAMLDGGAKLFRGKDGWFIFSYTANGSDFLPIKKFLQNKHGIYED